MLNELGSVIGVDREPGQPGDLRRDLADLDAVARLLDETQPEIVVNAAAYTAVDRAERDAFVAFRLNAELPGCLAQWCQRRDRLLLHYSTDYVFSGNSGRPYREHDQPGPLNAYGQSKLAGEWAIGASGCRHLVLRTSWVYSTHGNNFVLSMLRLAAQRPELNIVTDQVGCPTWARNLARVSAELLGTIIAAPATQGGVFHYCDATATSWHDFARLIFNQAVELELLPAMPVIRAIRTADYAQVARRPAYSVLDTSAIRSAFGTVPRPLPESLRACLEELAP